MIDGPQRKQILALMQTPQWGVLEQVAEQLKEVIKDEEFEYFTEWEYISKNLRRDGQVLGITRFFNELYKEVRNDQGRMDSSDS